MKSVINLRQQSVDLESGISMFLEEKKDNNLSESTIEYYDYVLSKAFLPIIGNVNVHDINKATVTDFIRKTKKTGVQVSTINVRLRGIRAFLNYLEEEGYSQPVKVKMLRDIEKSVQTFTKEHIDLLARKPKIKQFCDIRDWAMIMFLLATGIRLSSFVNIKIKDVNLVQRELLITHTKNKKELLLPASKSLMKILNEYLVYRKGSENDYLFCNAYGEKIPKRSVQDRIKKYCKARLGVTSIRYSPHTFRHTFAIFFLRKGGDIFTLQSLLDHATLDMTRKYLNLLPEDLRREYNDKNILDNVVTVKQGRKRL